MKIVREIDTTRELTPEEEKQLEVLKNMKDDEIVFDEDSPKLTSEQLKQFRRVSKK